MNVAHCIAKAISKPTPPPARWRDELPEAFGAEDEAGNVTHICYLGEWYVPVRSSLRVRLHNWLVRVGDRQPVDA